MFSQNGRFYHHPDGMYSHTLYGWHPTNAVFHELLKFDIPGEDVSLSPPSNDGTKVAWLDGASKISLGKIDVACVTPEVIIEQSVTVIEPLFRTLRFSCDDTRVFVHLIHGFPPECTVMVWDLAKNVVFSASQPEPIHSYINMEVHPTDRDVFLITQLCSFIAMDSPPHVTLLTVQPNGSIAAKSMDVVGDHAIWEDSGGLLASWSAKEAYVYLFPSLTLLKTFSLDQKLREKLVDPMMATILNCYFAWESKDVPVVFVEYEDLDPDSRYSDIPVFRQFVTPVYLGSTILQEQQIFDLGARGIFRRHKVRISDSLEEPMSRKPYTGCLFDQEFPDVIWAMILENLDPVTMLRVSRVSRLFHSISTSESYWKSVCLRESPHMSTIRTVSGDPTWRDFYLNRTTILDRKFVITQGPPGYFASFILFLSPIYP